MISTAIIIGGYRIYTGWLVIGGAALLFIATVIAQAVTMHRLNRKIKQARLQAIPSSMVIDKSTPQPSVDSAITEQLNGDGTEILDSNGTELLDAAASRGD